MIPYRHLRLVVSLPTPKSRVYVVAEVYDPKREYMQVMLEIGNIDKLRAAMRLGQSAPFRSQNLANHPEVMPILPVPISSEMKPIKVDGASVLAASGLKFRRWSHLRFDGAVTVKQEVLSRPQALE